MYVAFFLTETFLGSKDIYFRVITRMIGCWWIPECQPRIKTSSAAGIMGLKSALTLLGKGKGTIGSPQRISPCPSFYMVFHVTPVDETAGRVLTPMVVRAGPILSSEYYIRGVLYIFRFFINLQTFFLIGINSVLIIIDKAIHLVPN